eukprot:gb/GEZN01013108.1/.p1 GENE.gb/GEZN01013108.1/~~gb/GEZN01013108.1/.p1  ORF type:complete len:258 (+),score=35.17 gb/GEZN01013108.1/:91-864(+)
MNTDENEGVLDNGDNAVYRLTRAEFQKVVDLKDENEGLKEDLEVLRQEKLEMHQQHLLTQSRLTEIQRKHTRLVSDYKTVAHERAFLQSSLDLLRKEFEEEKASRALLESRLEKYEAKNPMESDEADPRCNELERTVLSRKVKRLEKDLKNAEAINQENIKALADHERALDKLQKLIDSLEEPDANIQPTKVMLGKEWQNKFEGSELLMELQKRNETIRELEFFALRSQRSFLYKSSVIVTFALILSCIIQRLMLYD